MRDSKRPNKKSKGSLVGVLMFRFFPYWPLFAVLVLSFFGIAWIYLQFASPVYEITATLLIKDEKKNDADSSGTIANSSPKRIAEHEIEVIRSRSLIHATAQSLQLCSPIFEEDIILDRPAYTSSPLLVEVKDIDKLRPQDEVEFFFDKGNNKVQLDGKKYALNSWIHTANGEIRFVKNPYMTEEGLGQFYVSFLNPRSVVESLGDRLTVAISNKAANILALSLRDAVPVRGENILNTLIVYYGKMAIDHKERFAESQLVDKAQASLYPVAPNRSLIYSSVIAFAFAIGIGWVLWKEVFNNTILFRSQIEAATRIPIAAEISDSRSKSYIVIDNFKKPILTDQFTQMRAAVGLYGGSAAKVVMVTSSIAGEGKTFVSTNFAISLAGANKKVLLLDLDLRNPRLSSLYSIASTAGVSDYLGGDLPIEKVIKPTATQNMFLIAAGKNRAGTSEVFMDGDLKGLFTKLRSMFDYIVVDTPPVGPVIDAYVISPYCDATLFVMRHGVTPKYALGVINDNARFQTMKNVSIVFNGVKPRGLIKNSYGYGYGSTYYGGGS